MTVCIFGGTGFVGRHLCEHLHRAGIPSFVTSREPDLAFLEQYAPSIHAVPLHDPRLPSMLARTDVVIYLGSSSIPGTSWNDPQKEIENNLASAAAAFRRVLDANPGCRIVYASSGGQLYGRGHTSPIAETCPAQPPTAYALGKYFIEATLEFFARVQGAKVTILRLANPVGRWQMNGRHGFVSAAVQALVTGRNLTIYGDGTNRRDYFDADDFAAFMARLLQNDGLKEGIFNIGSGQEYSEHDVLDVIRQIAGEPVPYAMAAARSFDIAYGVVDPSRAASELGWHARTSLRETVQKLFLALGRDVRYGSRGHRVERIAGAG